jgi:tight adherence protein C
MTPGFVAFLFGLAVFFAVYGVFVTKNNNTNPVVQPGVDMGLFPDAGNVERNERGAFEKYIRPTLRNFLPQTPLAAKLANSASGNKISEMLLQSGNPWRVTPVEYTGLRVLAAFGGSVIGSVLYLLQIPAPFPPVVALLFPLFGYLGPQWVHRRARSTRIEKARKELPEMLDLLRITMSAGRSFVPALTDVVNRMPQGLLKSEMKRVTDDLAAGRTLSASLTMFARRVPAEEVEGFVAAVVQTERLGSDVGTTLENQSAAVRSAHEGRLEKQIAALETLIIFPVLVGFMPAILAIIIAPALSQISAVLG